MAYRSPASDVSHYWIRVGFRILLQSSTARTACAVAFARWPSLNGVPSAVIIPLRSGVTARSEMSLTGVWMNELRSILLLDEDEDGALAGKFRSIVGRDPHVRTLTGRTSPVENGKQMLGFAVQFQIEEPGPGYGHYSVCTWCGWAKDKAPNPTITTHWLLTSSRLSKEDEWSSTTTGCDTFEKVLDSPEEKYLSADRQTLEQLLARSPMRER